MSGFTDDERDRIRDALLDAGREQFARYGLDKTTVSELADAAGIATGSFYSFFDSKERLYYEVLTERGEDAFARMTAAVEAADDPEAATRAFLREAFAVVEDDPLVRTLVYGGKRERVVRALSDDELDAAREEQTALLAPYVAEWQDAALARDGDPATLALAVQSVGFVAAHRGEFANDDQYEAVRDAMVDLVAAGLTATE
jgi:AcrR family transcriptional regulator